MTDIDDVLKGVILSDYTYEQIMAACEEAFDNREGDEPPCLLRFAFEQLQGEFSPEQIAAALLRAGRDKPQ